MNGWQPFWFVWIKYILKAKSICRPELTIKTKHTSIHKHMGIVKVAPGMSEFLHIHVSVSSLVLYEKPQSNSQVTVIKRISFLLVTNKLLSY